MQESTKDAVKQTIALCEWITNRQANYSQSTLDNAIAILWKIAEALDEHSLREPVPMPNLMLGDRGSICLSWVLEDCLLRITVSPDDLDFATYQGENDHGETISGELLIRQGIGIKILGRWLA